MQHDITIEWVPKRRARPRKCTHRSMVEIAKDAILSTLVHIFCQETGESIASDLLR